MFPPQAIPFEVDPAVAPLDLLVVAPHPDDAEISAGGTMAKLAGDGKRVGILDLTSGEPTPHGTDEKRREETDRATKELNVFWRGNLQLPNRRLVEDDVSRWKLASLFRRLRPQVVMAPYWEDAHPDHIVATQLIEASRFWAKLSRSDLLGAPFWPPKLYYYFSIHLKIHPRTSFVVDISQVIERKMAAISAYESQMTAGRPDAFPTVLDDIRDRARYWGWSIGKAYGEPFASREQIGVASPLDLIQ